MTTRAFNLRLRAFAGDVARRADLGEDVIAITLSRHPPVLDFTLVAQAERLPLESCHSA